MLWNILIGIALFGLNKYGISITDKCPQAGYGCPKICDVDHIHLPRKECINAKSWEETFQLYREGEESSKEVREKDNSQEEVLIEEHKDGKEKES